MMLSEFSLTMLFFLFLLLLLFWYFRLYSDYFASRVYNFWKMEKFLAGESSVKALKAFVGAFSRIS